MTGTFAPRRPEGDSRTVETELTFTVSSHWSARPHHTKVAERTRQDELLALSRLDGWHLLLTWQALGQLDLCDRHTSNASDCCGQLLRLLSYQGQHSSCCSGGYQLDLLRHLGQDGSSCGVTSHDQRLHTWMGGKHEIKTKKLCLVNMAKKPLQDGEMLEKIKCYGLFHSTKSRVIYILDIRPMTGFISAWLNCVEN